MRVCRLMAVAALAAAMASTTAPASASAGPDAISGVSPAPGAAAFHISDVGAAPTPGYDAPAGSGNAPVAPEDLFKITDISPH